MALQVAVPPTDGKLARAFRNARRIDRRIRRMHGLLDASGIKRWFVPGTEFEGEGALTPHAHKERRRRRSARKVAHESRRRNRT